MIAKIKQLFSFRFCLMLVIFCAGMYWTFFECVHDQDLSGFLCCVLFWFLFAGLVLRIIHKNKKQVWAIVLIVFCCFVLCTIIIAGIEASYILKFIFFSISIFVVLGLTIIFTKDKRQLFKGFVYYLALLLGIYITFHICLYAINGIRTRNILEVFVSEQQIREENQNSSNQDPLDEQSIQWHLVYPTMTISDNQVFYSTHNYFDYNLFLAWDKKTAQTQWSFQCGYPLINQELWYSQIYSAPLIFNDTVYFMCGFTLYANNRYTGQKNWTFSLTENIVPFFGNPYHDVYQPLIIYKNSLYVIDKKLAIVYALDPTKGTIKWQHQFERSGTERLMINNDELMYAYGPFYGKGKTHMKRYFLDMQTGKINRYDMIIYDPDFPDEMIDPEVIKKGIYYTTRCPDDKKTIQGDIPVNELKGNNIQLCAIDIKSGLKLWDYILPNSDRQDIMMVSIQVDGKNKRKVIIDGDLLFMITSYPDSNSNRQYALHAFNIKKRIEIWQQPLDDGSLDDLSLLISDHIIYLYNRYPFKNRMIKRFDLETGKELKPLKRDRNIY